MVVGKMTLKEKIDEYLKLSSTKYYIKTENWEQFSKYLVEHIEKEEDNG